MRVQEHLFQGFFGGKKKEDSAKYFKKRLDRLREIDEDLAKGVEHFKKILDNHANKLSVYHEFLNKLDKTSLSRLKTEIKKLEGMFDEDELANDSEKRYVIKVLEIIKDFTTTDDGLEIDALEKDIYTDLNSLKQMLETIGPLWEKQLDFIELNDDEILENKQNIQILSDIFREEGDVLRMEQVLLEKIELKTHTMMRKTSLKSQSLDRTEQSGMRYRELKHIR